MDRRFADAARSAMELSDSLYSGYRVWVSVWEKVYGHPDQARAALDAVGDAAVAGRAAIPAPHIIEILRSNEARGFGRELAMALDDVMVRRIWQRHRIAYQVDPDLWDELGMTADTDVIHPEVFQHLPHPDPYVHFPRPLIFDTGGDQIMNVVGMTVTGVKRVTDVDGRALVSPLNGVHCSTHDEGRTGLTLLFFGPIMNRNGSPVILADGAGVDAMFSRVSLTLDHGPVTFAAMADDVATRFQPLADTSLGGDPRHQVIAMLRKAVATLIYLCADNADVDRLPAAAGRAAAKVHMAAGRGKVKPPRVLTLGYRVGASLRRYRAEAGRTRPLRETGRSVRPHIRRAHFHTYRVGKGRLDRRVRWLSPIPINVDRDAEITTVIPV